MIRNNRKKYLFGNECNKQNIAYGIISILCLSFQLTYSQVGINTQSPKQQLHIASTFGTETIRVESLNVTNNVYNGGDMDMDMDLEDNTYPLYVDSKGEFTLEYKPLFNSDGYDAIDDSSTSESFAALEIDDIDGKSDVQITILSVTVNRPSILEVKYNISFDVYLDSNKSPIVDNLARRISTYFVLDEIGTRKYGPSSKCYTSGSTSSVNGTLYNASSAYIKIPEAGTYVVKLYGEVSSNVKGDGMGTNSKGTYVEFATGNDSIFLTLH